MSTVVSYPPHGVHVYINNRFRDPPSQPPFKFRCPQFAQPNNDQGYYLAAVKKVVTENLIYTVTQGQNDILCWNNDGTEFIYEVPEGNYTIDSLLTLLNTVLVPYNVNMVYDGDTRKIAATKTGVNVFFLEDPSSIRTFARSNLVQRCTRFLNNLGFYNEALAAQFFTGTVIATDPVNLNRTGVLFVNVYNNINVMHSDPQNPQTIISVPVDVGYGEKIVYAPATPPTFVMQPNALESLSIYVTDEWGQEVQVPDNTGLMIHLVLYQIF